MTREISKKILRPEKTKLKINNQYFRCLPIPPILFQKKEQKSRMFEEFKNWNLVEKMGQ